MYVSAAHRFMIRSHKSRRIYGYCNMQNDESQVDNKDEVGDARNEGAAASRTHHLSNPGITARAENIEHIWTENESIPGGFLTLLHHPGESAD